MARGIGPVPCSPGLFMAKINLTDDDLKRFWKYVKRGSENECWEWIGYREHLMGYGIITIGGRSGTAASAHRIAFQIANGEIPKGLCILHSCDNPACCNPAHLTAGTRKQNNADRDKRGRHVALKGSLHGNAILTEDQVREIKATHVRKYGWVAKKARELGVSRLTVSRIVNGRHWKHIT